MTERWTSRYRSAGGAVTGRACPFASDRTPRSTRKRRDAMEHARRSTCCMAVHHLRTVPRRLLLTAVAALLGFGVLTSFTAAAPVYGGWSAPVDLGPTINS